MLCYPVGERQPLWRHTNTWSSAERSPTRVGNTASRSCPRTAKAVANGEIIAPSSTASSGSSGPARPGATYPKDTASGRQTCLDRLNRWRRDGTWGIDCWPTPRDQERRSRGAGVGGERGRHRDPGSPACGGRQERAERGGRKKGLLNPEDEALGRSRGGSSSTKVHLACDGKGRPLSVVITPAGQRHGSTQLEGLLDAVRIPRVRKALRAGRASGPLTCWPTGVIASKVAEGCCAGGASPTPSPSARTRKSAAPGVRDAAGRVSTGRLTAGATWRSRGASTSSSSGGR